MIDRKEVELIVRANLTSSKQTLNSLNKSLGEIETSIDKQAAAAKRGEVALDELKASQAELLAVQQQLANKADLVGTFQRLGEQIAKTEDRVRRTAKAYTDYKAKLDAADAVTDKQQDRLVKLSAAHDRANAALAKQNIAQQQVTASLREAGIATDNLADAELKVRAAAAQIGVAINKTSEAIRTYAEDVRKARAAERELAASANLEKKISEARQLAAAQKAAQSADYIAFWERTLAAQEAAAAAFNNTADEALKAAQRYTTLSRASSDLTPKVVSLRDAVNSIINPASTARATLGGVEQQVQDLSRAVEEIKGPVKDYDDIFRQLSATQKSLSQQAGLVDQFRQQAVALRAARAEFVAARAQVTQYAAEVRKGGENGEKFTKALADAQNRARLASAALREQIGTTRGVRDALREAGISTNDLAAAESRLVKASRSTVTAVTSLTEAVDKYGHAAGRARKGAGLFGDEGRTTLSFVQRLRGEVLALAASYIGLQGSIGLASSALDSFNTRAGVKNQLALTVGQDRARIDEEYAYVKAQSDRIGVEFESAVKGYAKFAAAATLAGRSNQEIRYIFETFSEVGRVANLSADDLNGVYKALEQITSKGKIQAEELRGQLGDRLFGAFQVAAQSMKDTFPDLDKALKNGEVSAANLVRIAEQYRKIVAGQLPAAQQSLAAEQMRVNNAVFDFKNAIADAGFADEFKKVLSEITKFLQSADGQKFATDISGVFSTFAQVLLFALKNLDLLTAAAGTFFAVWAAGRVLGMVNDLKAVGVQAAATQASFKSLGTWVGILQAAFIGWQIGSIAYEKFAVVRKAGALLMAGLDIVFTTIRHSFAAAFEAFPLIAKNAFVNLLNTVNEMGKKVTGIFAKIARAAGMDGVADTLEQAIQSAVGLGTTNVDAILAKRRAALNKEIAAIKQLAEDSLSAEDIRAPGVQRSNPQGQPTDRPAISDFKVAGSDEGEIRKREAQIERIRTALEALEARTERSKKETLDAQLKAFDLQTSKLERDIVKLGGTEGNAFLKRFNELRYEARNEILRKFNDDVLKEQEGINRKLEAMDAAAGRKSKFELDARLAAISTSYEATYREIADFRARLEANNMSTAPADEARQRLDAGIIELKQLETRKFATEELKRREEAVNDVLKLRDDQIRLTREKVDAGILSDVEGAQRINELNTQAVPTITAAAEAARQWALANQTIFANPQQMEVFLAQMDVLIGKAQTATTEFTKFQSYVGGQGSAAISNGLDTIASDLGDIINGTKSASQGFKDMARSTMGVFANFLRDIALAIIKLQIFNMMKQSGNPYVAAIGAAGASSVSVNHSGGIIGRPSGSARSRQVNPQWFSNATRYHQGGFPGLGPNEVPAILEKNEEVLSKDSPRNLLNGGAAAGGAGQGAEQRGMRFVFLDDRAKVPEAMASAEGEEVVLQTIRRNAATIKQYMK